MKYVIETTGFTDNGPIRMHYNDDDLVFNTFLNRLSIFSYIRSLVEHNEIVAYPRRNLIVNGEPIWTDENGFVESWLKTELEYTLRN